MKTRTSEQILKTVLILACAGLVWFGALFRAAHDLWAACVVFLVITVLVTLFVFRFKPIRLPLIAAAALFLGAVWLSTLNSYDVNTSRLEAWGWTYCVILFYLLINVLETEKEWSLLLYSAGSVMIPLAAICLWQQLMRYPDNLTIHGIMFWEQWTGHPDKWGHWEIPATLINSQVLAGFALNWFFIFYRKWLSGKRSALIVLLPTVLVLALSRSAWAFICLAIGWLYFHRSFVLQTFKKHQRIFASAAILMVVVCGAIFAKKLNLHEGPYKGSSRFYYWSVACQLWRIRPWTGIGLGAYATAYPYFRSPLFQSTLFVHSFPLQWLVETGLVGAFAGLFLVARIRRVLTDKTAILSTLIVILFYSILSINLEYLINKLLLVILLAVIVSQGEHISSRVKAHWTAVFCASLWLLSPFWLKMFISSQRYTAAMSALEAGDTIKAEALFQEAVRLDSADSDALAEIAHTYKQSYSRTGSDADRENWHSYMTNALHSKKDIQYVIELNQIKATPSADHRTSH